MTGAGISRNGGFLLAGYYNSFLDRVHKDLSKIMYKWERAAKACRFMCQINKSVRKLYIHLHMSHIFMTLDSDEEAYLCFPNWYVHK